MKPYYYIYKHGDQGPRVRHSTIAEAQDEAERLAAKHPGDSFEILKCVGYSATSKASTSWMDGEKPPDKPRYRMLDEGETVQDGDEFEHPGGVWTPHNFAIGLSYGEGIKRTRRPL